MHERIETVCLSNEHSLSHELILSGEFVEHVMIILLLTSRSEKGDAVYHGENRDFLPDLGFEPGTSWFLD